MYHAVETTSKRGRAHALVDTATWHFQEHAVSCISAIGCTNHGRQTAQAADAPEHIGHRQLRIKATILARAWVLPWRPPTDVQGRQAARRLSRCSVDTWARCVASCVELDTNIDLSRPAAVLVAATARHSFGMWLRLGVQCNHPAPLQGMRPDRSGAAQRRPGGVGGSDVAAPARGSQGAHAAVLRCVVQPVRRHKTCAN